MPLTIKGTPQGLLLQPKAESWEDFLEALEHSLDNAPAFFQGGRVILDLEAREITEKALLALRTVLDRYDVELFAVLAGNEKTQRVIRSYGIRTRLPGERQTSHTPQQPAMALFVERTFRSGQQLNYPGDITIVGDVHAGAEVIAGGNIVVWGKVRGLLHAGANGDESALICALDLDPGQLRIAGYINRAPDHKRRKAQPEVAEIQDGMIIVKPWTARG
jgi:septum site-determining protein MinC